MLSFIIIFLSHKVIVVHYNNNKNAQLSCTKHIVIPRGKLRPLKIRLPVLLLMLAHLTRQRKFVMRGGIYMQVLGYTLTLKEMRIG